MADEEFAHASPANDPAWMMYYDAAQHSGDTGHSLYDSALCGRFVTDARERLRACLKTLCCSEEGGCRCDGARFMSPGESPVHDYDHGPVDHGLVVLR
jgi:hypothetical protein